MMLRFYRTADCPACDAIEENLDALLISHDVIVVDGAPPARAGVPQDVHAPALIDEGRVYEGDAAILQRLDELEAFKEEWYKYQSDACYCDEDER